MLESDPSVSICIPTFNRCAYIERTIKSCIDQTYKNIEIVVVDNASTDETEKVVSNIAASDGRVKYFRNKLNIGSGRNFLRSLECASGYFSQCLGDDDWLSKEYIETAVGLLKEHPEAGAVMTNIIALELKDSDVSFQFLDQDLMRSGVYKTDWYFKNAFSHPHVGSKGFISFVRREDLLVSLTEALGGSVNLLGRSDGRKEVIDSTAFWPLIAKYEYFVITDNVSYIKTVHGSDHVGFQVSFFEERGGFVRYSLALRRAYESFYRNHVVKYYKSLRRTFGVNIAIDIILSIWRNGNQFYQWRTYMLPACRDFFEDYTFAEKITIVFSIAPQFIVRSFKSFLRLFSRARKFVPDESCFLSKEMRFYRQG